MNRVRKGQDRSQGLAKLIDHTMLKPEATSAQIKRLCKEALEFGFASVCVNPANVALASKLLMGSGIPVCSVVGFPLGATTTSTKIFEALDAIKNGASEIDMVINIGALKSKEYVAVKKDIEKVVEACKKKAIVKVIIETSLLAEDEKITACEIAKEAGADFVKTSTGFGTGGATVEDIRLMRKTVGYDMGIKASGGIGDYESAKKILEAGGCVLGIKKLCRLGTSRSLKIMEGAEKD